MTAAPFDTARLKTELDGLLATQDDAGRLAADPIAFPHRWPAGPDREIVALFAALLAYGRADLIARALEDITARMGPTPAESAQSDDLPGARRRFDGVVYRFTRGEDLARLWLGAGAVLARYGTLEAAACHFDDPASAHLGPLLIGLRGALAAPTIDLAPRRGFSHLMPDPARGSACKRWHMLLRWMVRGPDAVDFGDWRALGAHRLTMPVDTHVHRIGRYIGLTARQSADIRTAREITDALRQLDPADPLRYDFALAHMGISGACPRRRVPAICAECPIQRICCLPG